MSLSRSITKCFIQEGIIDEEDEELYEYSFSALFEMGSNILIALLLGILLHKFVMSLLFLIIMIPLRSCAGGWHAKTSVQCFILSICYYLGSVLLPQYCLSFSLSSVNLLFIILATIIWNITPVDCIQKPMRVEEKKKMRKYGHIILLCISVLFLYVQLSGLREICLEIVYIVLITTISLVAEITKKSLIIYHS